MKTALLQLDIKWEDKKENFARVESFADKINGSGVDLIVLPELFSTGYTMNSETLAEDFNGETPSFLSEIAKKYNVNVLGSFIEKAKPKPKNSAILFDQEGGERIRYSKIHLPSFLEEDKNYSSGNKIASCDLNGNKIGMFICYDLRFPEIFRMVAENTECFFVIANWPRERMEPWDALLKARAIENQAYVVGVNRVGNSPNSSYSGHTSVIDPFGRRVAYAQEDEPEALVAEIDFSFVREVREKFPFLRDRKNRKFLDDLI